ncbi:MAG: helix-turn-helix domain-containing protein [Sandaracinaceae bacterium]
MLARASLHRRDAHTDGVRCVHHGEVFELAAVLHGSERARFDGTALSCHRNEYALIPPDCDHSTWTEALPSAFLNVRLRRDALDELLRELRVDRPFRPGAFAASPEVAHTFRALRFEVTSGEGDSAHRLALDSIATQLVIQLVRRHARLEPTPLRSSSGDDARLRRVRDWIRDEPTAAHSLEAMAALAGMSKFHFARSFKRVYGQAPFAYLRSVRVERVASLVRGSDLPLGQIAYDSGFGSPSRMTEAFAAAFGMTPSEYRAQQRAEAKTAIVV